MLLSMTGQGQGHAEGPQGRITVEIRTVNHRGLKVSPRLGEALMRFESRVEPIVRQSVHRGTVNVHAAWQRAERVSGYQIDAAVLGGYYRQLTQLRAEWGAAAPVDLTQLALLPGVVIDAQSQTADDEPLWQQLEQALREALENLQAMRQAEGEAMAQQIERDRQSIIEHLAAIRTLAPRVALAYGERLEAKIVAATAARGLDIPGSDLLREIQLFADRSDVSEEMTRLESHLGLLRQTMETDAASGRKLDFVLQEMFRETNTIGSKANDAEISHHVVEMKCALERIRELVQNIE